ncbi:MAG TPA: 3-methyladenine DNA glycosylase, partial [Mycobacterium sp.]
MSDCAVLLGADDWPRRAEAFRQRAERLLDPQRRRAAAGQPHPVWDFLFTYYSVRPGHLLCWHPGYGVVLAGAQARRHYLGRSGYVAYSTAAHPDGVTVGHDHLLKRLDTVRFIAGLLESTAARPAQLNCFGLHEWAMVYRSAEFRHGAVPLRLGSAGTDAVVESMPLRCSHFDAFRFFTAEAVPRNAERLTRESQLHREQPGCLHANMDLYKWALKLGPLVESDLLLDCLELAAAARELDMRASPYDLTDYGFAPIRVEQPAGRAEYARCQGEIAHAAAALRGDLLQRCHILFRQMVTRT